MRIQAVFRTQRGAETIPLWIKVVYRQNPGEVYPVRNELLLAVIVNMLTKAGLRAGLSESEARSQAFHYQTWEPATAKARAIVNAMLNDQVKLTVWQSRSNGEKVMIITQYQAGEASLVALSPNYQTIPDHIFNYYRRKAQSTALKFKVPFVEVNDTPVLEDGKK